MVLVLLLGAAIPSLIVGLIVGTIMSALEPDEEKKSKSFFTGLMYTTIIFITLIFVVGFFVKN